jgi:hypothetical protein
MSKMNEKSITALRDEELSAVSGAHLALPLWCFPKYPKYGSYTDNSKHATVTIGDVKDNTFTEKGPGDQIVNIGVVSQ